MQFKVRRHTLIVDIWWADPYGDNWGWFSETSINIAQKKGEYHSNAPLIFVLEQI